MTIAASSYADYIRALLGRPPVVGARRTIETPSVEPTLDGYVGFCTNSRQQFHSFLLLIDRADLIDGDPWSNQMDRQKGWDEWNEIVHAWTTKHTTADIVRMASELRIPVAPVHSGENILDCDHFERAARVRRRRDEVVQDAASAVAHGRRGSAAPAPGAPPRRAHRQHRIAHPRRVADGWVPTSCRSPVSACST